MPKRTRFATWHCDIISDLGIRSVLYTRLLVSTFMKTPACLGLCACVCLCLCVCLCQPSLLPVGREVDLTVRQGLLSTMVSAQPPRCLGDFTELRLGIYPGGELGSPRQCTICNGRRLFQLNSRAPLAGMRRKAGGQAGRPLMI